jgi:hypothetical protein
MVSIGDRVSEMGVFPIAGIREIGGTDPLSYGAEVKPALGVGKSGRTDDDEFESHDEGERGLEDEEPEELEGQLDETNPESTMNFFA